MSLYRGSSLLVDAAAFVDNNRVKFSRAGGIMAGVAAIQTPPGNSLAFIVDADMVVRPGFFYSMLKYPVPGLTVYYPVCWHMCFGKGLSTLPKSPKQIASRTGNAGFWRNQGYGMVSIYVADLNRVGGMRYG
jgi:hypothetical protein